MEISGTDPATAARSAANTSTDDLTKMPTAIIGGDLPSPDEAAAAEAAKAEADKKAAEAEPKYDKNGFELDKDGKQKLDADGKPIAKPAETKAPAKYAEFKAPEGAAIDEPTMTEFKAMAKELDLTQEQAQHLLDFGGEKIKALAAAPYKAWSDLQTKWQAEIQADPEIGGTNMETTVASAARVYQLGPDNPFVKSAEEATALKDALNTTGSGNNPAIVRLFSRLGKMLGEPGTVTGAPNPKANEKGEGSGAMLDAMYPTMAANKSGAE
jgi:hypothetical protein